jgi:uncharacterized protein (TIGR02217 family)
MSYNVFPTFIGRTWDIKKRPITSTLIQQADSGAEYRTSRYQYPLYEFDIEIEYLSQADFGRLIGFFNQQGGPFTPFYWTNDNDNTATNYAFGTGNGTTTQFQLSKFDSSYWNEPIAGVNGTPTIYVNGVATTPASISASGLVTFSSAPANGASLTWTGNYYYLVRFKDDQIEVGQFMSQMYEATTITLRTFR